MSPALAGSFFTTKPPGKPTKFPVVSFQSKNKQVILILIIDIIYPNVSKMLVQCVINIEIMNEMLCIFVVTFQDLT